MSSSEQERKAGYHRKQDKLIPFTKTGFQVGQSLQRQVNSSRPAFKKIRNYSKNNCTFKKLGDITCLWGKHFNKVYFPVDQKSKTKCKLHKCPSDVNIINR